MGGDGLKVEHAIFGAQAVFTVGTKTLSEPSVGDAHVRFDGTTLKVDSYVLDRDPLVQARVQAGWVRWTLEE